jgi:hypothetical protein
LKGWLPPDSLVAEVILVGLLSGLGGGVYLLALYLLRVQELSLLSSLLKRFLPRQNI